MTTLDYQSRDGSNLWWVWNGLVDRVGGRVIEEGGRFVGVRVEVGEWTIEFDAEGESTEDGRKHYTRVFARLADPDGFRFRVWRRAVSWRVPGWLGAKKVLSGEPAFDRAFPVRSNDVGRFRRLLEVPSIREVIEGEQDFLLGIRGSEDWLENLWWVPLGPEEALLFFRSFEVIEDVERLRGLYVLFALTLNQLCRVEG